MLSEDLVSCPKQAVGKQTVPTLPKQAALLLGTVKYDLSTGQGEPIRVDFYRFYNHYKFYKFRRLRRTGPKPKLPHYEAAKMLTGCQ